MQEKSFAFKITELATLLNPLMNQKNKINENIINLTSHIQHDIQLKIDTDYSLIIIILNKTITTKIIYPK